VTQGEIENLLKEAEKRLEREPRLIEINSERVIFVGDTHGDLEASQIVIKKYLKPGNTIVFLGDYVDRGAHSAENINYLLSLKLQHPESLFLLMGNHEGPNLMPFQPADFWERLDRELYPAYAQALAKLPLVASTSNSIIALHGALPEVESLAEINKIVPGNREWRQITWGDWQEVEGYALGDDPWTGRPQFGRNYFEEVMSRFGKNVLIRSHQPGAAPVMYNKRCLTVFTSSAYYAVVPTRTIAIADLKKEIKTADDIVIETI